MAQSGSWVFSPHSQLYFHFFLCPPRKPSFLFPVFIYLFIWNVVLLFHILTPILGNNITTVPCKNIQKYTFQLVQPCARSDIDYTLVVSITRILHFWDKIITSSNLFSFLLIGVVFCCLFLFFFLRRDSVILETVCTRLALCFLCLQRSSSMCLKDGFIIPSEQTQSTEQSYFVQNMSYF